MNTCMFRTIATVVATPAGRPVVVRPEEGADTAVIS
jgi:hypothetical protein